MSNNLKYDKINIELRRGKVLELLAKGHSKSEIAKTLNVSNALITMDVQYLQCAAQENVKSHIERIPMQFEECNTGLKIILRKAYHIIDNSSRPQDQLNAMSLCADIYSKLMDLSTNGEILTKTLRWISEQKKQQQPLSDDNKPTEEEEQKQIEEHFGGKGISADYDTKDEDITESEEPVPIEQDEELKED
jgi:hypothetical protein